MTLYETQAQKYTIWDEELQLRKTKDEDQANLNERKVVKLNLPYCVKMMCIFFLFIMFINPSLKFP